MYGGVDIRCVSSLRCTFHVFCVAQDALEAEKSASEVRIRRLEEQLVSSSLERITIVLLSIVEISTTKLVAVGVMVVGRAWRRSVRATLLHTCGTFKADW